MADPSPPSIDALIATTAVDELTRLVSALRYCCDNAPIRSQLLARCRQMLDIYESSTGREEEGKIPEAAT